MSKPMRMPSSMMKYPIKCKRCNETFWDQSTAYEYCPKCLYELEIKRLGKITIGLGILLIIFLILIIEIFSRL